MDSPLRADTAEEAAAIADFMQATYYRGFFESERQALAKDLAKFVKALTECTNAGNMGEATRLRRTIRGADSEIRAIDRLIEGLDRRFPAAALLEEESR
jgi:hypothetical protein